MGKVYIAGAGPGDKGCLTLKVKDIIEKADVILYDNLVSDEIIALSKPEAILVDVGKISGFHKVKQENINKYLIDYASKFDKVLRLKGGDPFVFGRGAEEVLELAKSGVSFEIMPGVSSVTSVPESIGVPITYREIASSFYVITGKKKKDTPLKDEDYKRFANLKDTTLIFMMSMKIANEIATKLIKNGKDENTPAVVISNGTLANEKKYHHTLKSLSKLQNTDIFEMPGMLVVGEVANLSESLTSKHTKPLNSRRIIINVPKEKGDRLEQKLYALGAQVVNISTNSLEKSYNKQEFKNLIENLKAYEYLCFTSTYAVDSFFEILYENDIDIRSFGHLKFAAVGKTTKQALKNKGILTDVLPDEYNGLSLSQKLINIKADNIICLLPKDVKSDLYEELLKNKKNCLRFDIYKKISRKIKVYNERLDDIYVFTSSSSVYGLASQYEDNHFENKLAFCIGSSTQNTAKNYHFKTIVSKKASLDELVNCIVEYFK